MFKSISFYSTFVHSKGQFSAAPANNSQIDSCILVFPFALEYRGTTLQTLMNKVLENGARPYSEGRVDKLPRKIFVYKAKSLIPPMIPLDNLDIILKWKFQEHRCRLTLLQQLEEEELIKLVLGKRHRDFSFRARCIKARRIH